MGQENLDGQEGKGLKEIEVERARGLLLALVLSLAVLTAVTIVFSYLRYRNKVARGEIGRGDLESLELVFPSPSLFSYFYFWGIAGLMDFGISGYPSSEDDEIRRMKLRKSPRRKLRDVEKGRITGLEGVVRGGEGERWGNRGAVEVEWKGVRSGSGSGRGSGSKNGGHARCASEGGEISRVDDRVRAGYDGFRGN